VITKKITLPALILFFYSSAFSQDLQSWIDLAQTKSERLLAVSKNLESLEAEIKSRDIALSGQFVFQAENFHNDQDAVTFARRSRSRFIDLIYEKPFSTGTLLNLTTGHDRSKIDTFGIRHTADWEVKITQSLWRNAFGRDVGYRHEGERAELLSRKATLVNTKQQLLIDVETLYWDLSLALKVEQIRLKNLEISKNLKSWTLDRVKVSTAEKSDLYQAQALLSSRQLDLISAQNQIETLKNKIQQVFPLNNDVKLLPNINELEQTRNPQLLLATKGELKNPQRLDALSASYFARQTEIQAQRIREAQKPELNAYVSYGQNGITQTFEESWNHAGSSKYAGTRFGIILKIPLDRSLVAEQERAAILSSMAQSLNSEALNRITKLSWEDILRRLEVLKSQVSEAQRLSDFQNEKVRETRRLYRLGRTTVFQLVTFEVEAADAEIRKFTFLSELRKLESQARLFTGSEDIL
jgi:outer membrane protein TolC